MTTSTQIIAWLVSVGRQSLADRGASVVDGEAITAILAASNNRYPQEAAEAIRQLSTEEVPVE